MAPGLQTLPLWLTEKYAVKQAYLFMGLIPKYKDLYTYLSECGFTLVFKDVVGELKTARKLR